MNYRSSLNLVAAIIATLMVSACGQTAAPPPERNVTPVLPVSLNEIMVALVNHSADPIWVAAWKNPESDQDWRELELLAYQLEIAGMLLTMPGTGPMDPLWAADPEWQRLAQQLSLVGKKAVSAAQDQDLNAINRVGDQLVAVCEACHLTFKPAEPTGGKYGELSPTAQDFERD